MQVSKTMRSVPFEAVSACVVWWSTVGLVACCDGVQGWVVGRQCVLCVRV